MLTPSFHAGTVFEPQPICGSRSLCDGVIRRVLEVNTEKIARGFLGMSTKSSTVVSLVFFAVIIRLIASPAEFSPKAPRF